MIRRPVIVCLSSLALLALLPAQPADNDASIEKLRLVNFVMPDFPEMLRASGHHRGVVTVAIGRDAEGLVNDVLVLDSTHTRLTLSTVEAVKRWKFARPANLQPPGRPIVPIVRFFFGTKGVVMVPTSGGLVGRDRGYDRFDNPPVELPSFADLDAVPKPIHAPRPKFTGSAAGRVEGGSAIVKFFVDETGKVRVPIVLECSTPELGLAALAAIEQWTYEPPRLAGRPTIAIETGTVTFARPRS
ncbi:MAG: energy transducer TonB [Verrucomicrobia bacterium]|nr:energy transducer TonB [Verrucomicrobiota bacterium]